MLGAKKPGRKKHVSLRTCVGCREVLAKRSLIRVVRSPDGVQVDLTGKMNGRGAYLHDQLSCWQKGLKGALTQALKTELTEEERKRLSDFAATLVSSEVSLSESKA
jgi:predicted RNA-binding protein YlxR (DUF448 family)